MAGLPAYRNPVVVSSTPGALGEIGIDGSGRFTYHNGTRVVVLTERVESQLFTYNGPLTVYTGVSRWYVEAPCTWLSGRLAVNTAPTGAALICDVLKNGTTIFTTTGNRPTIAAGASGAGMSQVSTTPDVTTFVAGDYLQFNIVQIGSTIAGSDLSYSVRLRET